MADEQVAPAWNASQRGFLKWLAAIAVSALGGSVLMLVAGSRVAGMETIPDMAVYSWLDTGGGLLFLVSSVASVATLIYGRRHEAAIRESDGFSHLLTAYRVLFWLLVMVSLLAGAFLIWVISHFGPVR